MISAHYFLKVLQDKEKLSKYYTQNIDGLEKLAGLEDSKVIEAHGTFSSAACSNCGEKYDIDELKEKILLDEDPVCRSCGGWVKPKIVFFGEQLPPRFFDEAELDCEFCDQMICIGTSLEVYPFAGKTKSTVFILLTIISIDFSGIVDAPKHKTPRLLINSDLVGSFGARPNDAALLGDLVLSIEKICEKLEWTEDLLEAQIENELNLKVV